MAEILMITSGKGGVGKSTVCGFLGEALARRGKRVLMLETTQRSLDVMFGVSDRVVYDLSDVAQSRCTLEEAMIRVCPKEGKLVCAPMRSSDTLPTGEQYGKMLQEAEEGFDFILVEVSGRDTELLDWFASLVHRVVVVTTADRTSARESRIVSDRLAYAGVEKLHLCVNMLAPDFLTQRPVPDLDWLIDTICAQLISVCSFQPQMFSAVSISDSFDSSKNIAIIFDNFAQRILGKHIDLWVW